MVSLCTMMQPFEPIQTSFSHRLPVIKFAGAQAVAGDAAQMQAEQLVSYHFDKTLTVLGWQFFLGKLLNESCRF